jgi:hypothetical protein
MESGNDGTEITDLNERQDSSNAFTFTGLSPEENIEMIAGVNSESNEAAYSLNYKRSFNKIFELTDDELNLIEETLRNKIIKNGENFIQQNDNLRITYEKLKIECEQRFVELESEYNECQSKLSVESKNSFLFRKKADENGKLRVSIFLVIN